MYSSYSDFKTARENFFNSLANCWPVEDVSAYLKSVTSVEYLNYLLKLLVLRGESRNFSPRDKSVIKLLLENGAEPLSKDDMHAQYGRLTMFEYILYYKDSDLIITFMDHMKEIDHLFIRKHKSSSIFNSLLHAAVDTQLTDVLQHVVNRKPDMNKKCNCYDIGIYITPLHQAAAMNNLKITRILLENGADVEVKGNNNRTPLFYAVEHGQIEQVKLLLQYGASFRAKDDGGLTLLDHLCMNNRRANLELCQLLLDIDGESNAFDAGKALSLLPYNVYLNSPVEYAKLLIENGAKIQWKKLLYSSAYHLSPLLSLVVRKGDDMRILNKKNETLIDVLKDRKSCQNFRGILKDLILLDVKGTIRFNVDLVQSNLSDVEEACRQELGNLRNCKIAKSSTASWFTLLTSNDEKIVQLCRNQVLKAAMFELNESKFPIYGSGLISNIKSGLRRNNVESSGFQFFQLVSNETIDFYSIREILKFLTTRDLKKLRKCLSCQ